MSTPHNNTLYDHLKNLRLLAKNREIRLAYCKAQAEKNPTEANIHQYLVAAADMGNVHEIGIVSLDFGALKAAKESFTRMGVKCHLSVSSNDKACLIIDLPPIVLSCS